MNNYKKKAALFLASQGITLFGSSLAQFALIWYVTGQTSSGGWVSAMTIAAFVPQFLVSCFSGVLADRYSKKKLIILSDAMIAAATLLFAILFPKISDGTPILLALVGISAIRSVVTGIQTPAVNAAVTQLVPQDKLMKFNGYRVYTEQDLQRLKIIRSLRCANYSLEAILQLLQQLSKNSQTDVRSALNTPRRSDDIISVCARLIVSLSSAERNAFRVSELLLDMKNKFQ